ncbi:MAG: putative metallo-hydrolase [Firmicutes bacterium ADurb.Bin300]|jgi:hydroxyacylglutathione hydrolase|nr:MAG: putative metallo-hydrolase [Firmicutes bacterium ADurb.Bin300]
MTLSKIPLGLYAANCYVLCDTLSGEGVVIDPGEFSDDLISLITDSGVKSLKYILLTHGHFDHILGVNRLKEHFPDAKTAIGAPDEICLSSVEDNLMGREYADSFSQIQSDFLLYDADCLEIGSGKLEVIATPGHSKGGVCFVSPKDKFVITGDTLFYRTAGRTDFKGGSFEELSASVDRLMLLDDDYIVYPGHNKSTVIGEERIKNRFIRNR